LSPARATLSRHPRASPPLSRSWPPRSLGRWLLAALGRRSRGQDHKQAVELLAQILPGGPEASVHLDRLLDLKDGAHYGVIHVTTTELKIAMRQARALVEFATAVLAQ